MFDISGGGPTTNDLINNVSVNLSYSTMWHVGTVISWQDILLTTSELGAVSAQISAMEQKVFPSFFICTVCYSLSVTNITPLTLAHRQMGPRRLAGGVILLRIEVWIITRREGPEEVARDLK